MNLKNMRRLRARLRSRRNPVGFEMHLWFRHKSRRLSSPAAICRAAEKHPCGTAACLAGHAALIAWQNGDMPKTRGIHTEIVASKWLGLNWSQSHNLFRGYWGNAAYPANLWGLTKARAITELTRLIDAEAA